MFWFQVSQGAPNQAFCLIFAEKREENLRSISSGNDALLFLGLFHDLTLSVGASGVKI